MLAGARTIFMAVLMTLALACGGGDQSVAGKDEGQWKRAIDAHPSKDDLARFFPTPIKSAPSDFKPTGLTRKDYLTLIAGNVDFWKQHQDDAGAIIDPYEGAEKQYSTPAFAHASALLVAEAGRKDLLDSSVRAFSFALTALQNQTSADAHADFYIPMLMHAHRILKSRAPADVAKQWDEQLRSLIPQDVYRATSGGGNWNLVNVAGEALRRKDKLVAADQMEAQQEYIDSRLQSQLDSQFDPRLGMYVDANAPLAYDVFPRLWLEDVLADDAYRGPHRAALEELLVRGALSTMLLLSPSGEWACGGRSSNHQWNEAAVAVVAEINAKRWKQWGRADVAGAFKRMAHLSTASLKRWVRPSGELWIVKNRADPEKRFAYEGYSFHSQYNLLVAAMLAIAYERADETIEERPTISEAGSYVFDAREPFHKVCAAAGGTYVLIDTGADLHYDGTGLLRVHKEGVELSPVSDSAGPNFKNNSGIEGAGLTPGIQWRTSDAWIGLAHFGRAEDSERIVSAAELERREVSDGAVKFAIKYKLDGDGARPIIEEYSVTRDGVDGVWRVEGANAPMRAAFPVLVSDGENAMNVTMKDSELELKRPGGTLVWKVGSPEGVKLEYAGPTMRTHNGNVQAAAGELPPGTHDVKWSLRLK